MIGNRFLTRSLVVERATAVTDLNDDIVYDDRGVATRTWTTHLTLQGSNQPLTAREVEQLSGAGPVASTHKVFLPGTPDVVASDRIVDGDVTFAIDQVVDPASAGHHLELLCHAVTDAVLEVAA